MQADPARTWSLGGLASLCRCCPDTFGRRFRAALGCTPVQWLRAHRARLAAHRLITTDESLAGIARAVGFGSRPYLSRVFRSVLGVGPADYRRAKARGGRPLG
jgi:transcriptional regulator GlxA family with amidase domain